MFTYLIKEILYKISPKLLVSIEFYHLFKKKLDWKSPKDLNEKINWLKFNSDTSQWSILADKYKVREYIKNKGLEYTLVKLYGCWYSAKDIDWSSLPNKFVLKTNNGSGDILICHDKEKLNIEDTETKFEKLLTKTFGGFNGEPHYATMKPCIIAEELLSPNLQSIESSSLVDYKIWCFNGEPYCIWVCCNRKSDSVTVSTYDLDWNFHPEWSIQTSHYQLSKSPVPKPVSLNKMLEIARILSSGFPQVRVDLYEVNDTPYFGELTFTSAGGFNNFFTQEFLLQMGNQFDIN